MPDGTEVLAALREELIAAALVRRPSEGANATGSPYPLVIEPYDGPPAPGELGDDEVDHNELVVSAFYAGGLGAADGFEASTRKVHSIDLRYRSKGMAALRAAMDLDAAIRARIIRPETNYGYGWVMGTAAPLFVHQATPIGDFAPLSRSRDRGFDHVAKWWIETAP